MRILAKEVIILPDNLWNGEVFRRQKGVRLPSDDEVDLDAGVAPGAGEGEWS
jgi:hypothetical protein